MAYRMRMFMSQKPSSVDLRVSDFKRVPGFNYVLPVLAEDEHTYDSLCSDIREAWSINAESSNIHPSIAMSKSFTTNSLQVLQVPLARHWHGTGAHGALTTKSGSSQLPLFRNLET